MSVQVSQLNRAVSMASVEAITTARKLTTANFFALPGGHNTIDGTYTPFTNRTDAGWWGDELSDANGSLPNPAILTVTERLSAYSFIVAGIGNNYPVDFTIKLYKDNVLQHEATIVDNTEATLEILLDKAYDIDSYVLTITRISVGYDVLKVSSATFNSGIFSLMKEPDRRIHGRVEVAYNNLIKDTTISINDGAYGSISDNLTNGLYTPSAKFFKLYDNKLDGTYKLIGTSSEVGWWPKTMPDSDGVYAKPYTLVMQFSERSLHGLTVYGDGVNGDFPVDFTVRYINQAGTLMHTVNIVGNESTECFIPDVVNDITSIEIDVLKTSRPARPAVIMNIPVESVVSYSDDRLIDISLLEELTYEDSLEKLGGVSANELVINFANDDRSFNFNNAASPVSKYLKKNKRVKAWLGIEVPGTSEILWSALGTFWTHSWDVKVGSLTANCVAFDTLGLLSTRPYYKHYVQLNKSIGELIETVLIAAKEELPFIEWHIDDALYDIIIPIAWFNNASYTAALNRLASCDLFNIYCDRDGSIVASMKIANIETPKDVWSDSTNVISKTYPTLYTSPANHISVGISKATVEDAEVLKIEDINEAVTAGEVCTYNFSNPVVNLTSLTVDTTATFTYDMYSWGIMVTFTSSGTLTSISATAKAVVIDNSSSVLLRNEGAIAEDGVIECTIQSDLIQTSEHASRLASYLYDKATLSIYDTEVEYRGDISLTLNNIINLSEGIAPTNLYYIKRHELYWNGALHGSARLNT